jgi:hypothetical protein
MGYGDGVLHGVLSEHRITSSLGLSLVLAEHPTRHLYSPGFSTRISPRSIVSPGLTVKSLRIW